MFEAIPLSKQILNRSIRINHSPVLLKRCQDIYSCAFSAEISRFIAFLAALWSNRLACFRLRYPLPVCLVVGPPSSSRYCPGFIPYARIGFSLLCSGQIQNVVQSLSKPLPRQFGHRPGASSSQPYRPDSSTTESTQPSPPQAWHRGSSSKSSQRSPSPDSDSFWLMSCVPILLVGCNAKCGQVSLVQSVNR